MNILKIDSHICEHCHIQGPWRKQSRNINPGNVPLYVVSVQTTTRKSWTYAAMKRIHNDKRNSTDRMFYLISALLASKFYVGQNLLCVVRYLGKPGSERKYDTKRIQFPLPHLRDTTCARHGQQELLLYLEGTWYPVRGIHVRWLS